MKAHGLAVKSASLGVLLFAGCFLLPENSSAQSCPYTWPEISIEWRFGPDNYYTYGNLSSAGFATVVSACNSYCFGNPTCEPVDVHGDQCWVDIDGQFSNNCGGWIPFPVSGPAEMAEGGHNVAVRFTAKGYATSDEHPYSFSKAFYVDKTPPVIISTKPAAGVVISTADLTMSGSVSDTASKIGVVNLGLSVESGGCQVRKDTNTVPSAGFVWSYCDSEVYDSWMGEGCDENIGTPSNFVLDRDLRDYIFFTSTLADCRLLLSAAARDRVGNGSAMPNISFTIDQAAPAISISTWPGRGEPAFISSPAIAGLATDSSEITYIKLMLLQKDQLGVETYWSGTEWAADSSTPVNLEIPLGTNTIEPTHK